MDLPNAYSFISQRLKDLLSKNSTQLDIMIPSGQYQCCLLALTYFLTLFNMAKFPATHYVKLNFSETNAHYYIVYSCYIPVGDK